MDHYLKVAWSPNNSITHGQSKWGECQSIGWTAKLGLYSFPGPGVCTHVVFHRHNSSGHKLVLFCCFFISIAWRQSIQWERILLSMIKIYLVYSYEYKYIKGDWWENSEVCKSMFILTFLPRFKYLYLMCDIVMARGEWTFPFTVCLNKEFLPLCTLPRFVLCYLLVHICHITHAVKW